MYRIVYCITPRRTWYTMWYVCTISLSYTVNIVSSCTHNICSRLF